MSTLSRRQPALRSIVLVLICLVPWACDAAVVPDSARQTHVPLTEAQPGPGMAVIRAEPPVADRRLTIELADAGGRPFGPATLVEPGDILVASGIDLPGPHRIRVNGELCEGTIRLVSDRTTDVVVRLAAPGCEALQVGFGPWPS